MKVLVTHGWCRTAYGVARSLAQAGHEVHAASPGMFSMTGASRHTRTTSRIPDPFVDPKAYVLAIAHLSSELGIDAVFPVHEDALVLRQHEATLPQNLVVACPSLSLLELTLDKGRFARFPFTPVSPLPETLVPDDLGQVRHALSHFNFPLVIKTRRGNGGKGVLRLDEAAGAFEKYQEFTLGLGLSGSLPCLQRFVQGEAIGACFLASAGRLEAVAVERYLRAKESGFGTSVLREPVDSPTVEAITAEVVRDLNYDGLGHIDFIVDRDGRPWLLELNPRIWGALELSLANGFDFPAAYLDQLQGLLPSGRFVKPESKKRALWLVGEGIALLGELRSKKDPTAVIDSIQRVFLEDPIFDDAKLDDPLPLLVEALHYGAGYMQSGGNLNPVSGSMLGQEGAAPTRDSFYFRRGKRWLDVSVATLALFLLAPFLALLGALLLVTSGRPIFFTQQRVGRGGRLFWVYKFRTMVPGAESGGPISVANDPRTTRVGRWARKLKVDELPQLLNVIRGDMSLVGPRPDVPGYADELSGEDRRILELLPGITGPATLRFADEEALLEKAADPELYNREVIFPKKVRINLEYRRNVQLGNDLSYMLQTLGIFRRRGL